MLSTSVLVLAVMSVVVGSLIVVRVYIRRLKNFLLISLLMFGGSIIVFTISHETRLVPGPGSPFLESIRFAKGNPLYFGENLTDITIAATLLLAVAASVLLHTSINRADKPIRLLARQVRRLRTLLYLGAVLLIANTVSVSILYRWSAVFATNDAKQTVLSIAQSVSFSTGAIHTLLLIGLYLPASLLLTCRAYSLAQSCDADPTKESVHDWLVRNGLISTPGHILSRGLVVFGPLLAGSIIPLLAALLK